MVVIEKGRRWYAVHCKPSQEFTAEEHLARQKFCVYLPRIALQRGRSPIEVIAPLFPRYLFVHVDFDVRSSVSVRATRGVVDLVRFGGMLATLPCEAIEVLKRRADANGVCRIEKFSSGDAIRLTSGPFNGLEGVFIEKSSRKRVVVLLNVFAQVKRVVVDQHAVVKR